MNVKGFDDLNICTRTSFINVHMFGEIGASMSIPLIPVHFVTDEHMSIHTYLWDNTVLLHFERCSKMVKIVDDTVPTANLHAAKTNSKSSYLKSERQEH